MKFEYDPTKSHSNLEKHGIGFEESMRLWQDERRIQVPARSSNEPREAIIAGIDGTVWTAIFTMRNETVRIISVRRSRDEEREVYHNR